MGIARALLEALLIGGWVVLDEQRKPRMDWQPLLLQWTDQERLAALLGLPDVQALRAQTVQLQECGFDDNRLPALADSLEGRPPALVLKRMRLLHALDRWLREGRHGTRREFALFARDDTKDVSVGEWQWLDEALGLEALGVGGHTPGLWLRAPLQLRLPGGVLDVAAVPDLMALSPATLQAVAGASGRLQCWRVVENRTSFEQAAAAHGAEDGVLWVPGFAPRWWQRAVTQLLRAAPAQLLVACDPDPAGIRIALSVAQIWETQGLEWQPWRMNATDLLALRARKPLGAYDHAELMRLRELPLPPALAALADALLQHGFKGEQEGMDLRVRA
ncbi:DUF2399 domain-containing protein [Pseudoxanthomonas wuyuanensis]|uniref:DUF2399 domain-containing protein n=1 Tax=Pseudoxanthomonas wuyuanensis TaxID=1073196 RepID=A0A286D7D8_9GAMM|nr:DUF2399 domain-containing protein [Pseudoxanthomonas wuyuanensis]KAF1719050.1 DUF2399 domain-containing protein [Pseudoxanthomonas wuyuanensis]SOD54576.1 Protein of unknown function C-terminus [Pseudoxanthomonas wuyuanensis]